MKKVTKKQEKEKIILIKRGFCNGVQIWYNKETKKHFLETKKERGFSKELKNKAIELYLEGNSLRTIGRVIGCSQVSVMNWIKLAAGLLKKASLYNPVSDDSPIVEMDEMWHFIQKKRKNCGSGFRFAEKQCK